MIWDAIEAQGRGARGAERMRNKSGAGAVVPRMTDFILDPIAWGGYLGIFLLMALENIVPPIPSEVIMGLGGMAVARGDMAIVPLIAVRAPPGTTLGNYFWYWIGRQLGYRAAAAVRRPLGPLADARVGATSRSSTRFFLKHGGNGSVFVFRFLPTFRTMISLPAGMAGMPHVAILPVRRGGQRDLEHRAGRRRAITSAANFGELERYVGPVAIGLIVAIVLGYIYRVITWRPRG